MGAGTRSRPPNEAKIVERLAVTAGLLGELFGVSEVDDNRCLVGFSCVFDFHSGPLCGYFAYRRLGRQRSPYIGVAKGKEGPKQISGSGAGVEPGRRAGTLWRPPMSDGD